MALLYRLRRVAFDHGGTVHIKKSVNPVTGAASNYSTSFSALNFGIKTRQCASSASKLSPVSLDVLLEAAHQRANVPRMPERQTPMLVDDEFASDFSQLVEGI